MPIADIYWEPAYVQDAGCPAMLTYGKRSHIYILSCVCLLLLLTGIINFINLYLIGTQRRGKEYGLKNVRYKRNDTFPADINRKRTFSRLCFITGLVTDRDNNNPCQPFVRILFHLYIFRLLAFCRNLGNITHIDLYLSVCKIQLCITRQFNS